MLRSGGVLIAGFVNPAVYLFDKVLFERTGELRVKHTLPYSDVECLTEEEKQRYREQGIPLEFSHTLEDQIGGQIAAGFVITGFYEDHPRRDDGNPLEHFMAAYMATRAVRR